MVIPPRLLRANPETGAGPSVPSPRPVRCCTRWGCLKADAHRLGLGVLMDDVLAHLPAPSRLLVAAEGQRGVEDVVCVDPHGAGLELRDETVCLGQVVGPDPGRQAV